MGCTGQEEVMNMREALWRDPGTVSHFLDRKPVGGDTTGQGHFLDALQQS
jgi:hypothetical protein